MEVNHVTIALTDYEQLKKEKETAEMAVAVLKEAILGIAKASTKVGQVASMEAGSRLHLSHLFREAGFRVDFISKHSIPSLGEGEKVIKIEMPE